MSFHPKNIDIRLDNYPIKASHLSMDVNAEGPSYVELKVVSEEVDPTLEKIVSRGHCVKLTVTDLDTNSENVMVVIFTKMDRYLEGGCVVTELKGLLKEEEKLMSRPRHHSIRLRPQIFEEANGKPKLCYNCWEKYYPSVHEKCPKCYNKKLKC